jgi:16S rRNA A1518/A1519 N6-dimethyltransferase RsmA/KsgA/DIM1 with predicted DNA glycosylase/AP lyase activity
MNKALFLDQNFLTDESVYETIRAVPEYMSAKTILEIGPGKGFITSMLFADEKQVTAIEIDPYLVKKLKNDFRGITLHEGDAYRLLNDVNFRKQLGNIDLFISSIPYSRAQNILHCFASNWVDAPLLFGVPKGFAETVSKDFYLGAYFTSHVIRDIPRSNYNPPPKVDSQLVLFSKISMELTNSTWSIFVKRYLYKHEGSKLKNALVEGLIEYSLLNNLEFVTQKKAKAFVMTFATIEFDQLVSTVNLSKVSKLIQQLEPQNTVERKQELDIC